MHHVVEPLREFTVERLTVRVYGTRQEMGNAAGREVAERIRRLLAEQKNVRILFAAAPSQNEFLRTLAGEPGIDWSRVIALHLDEYLGVSEDSPQSFRRYLKEHIFLLVYPGQIHLLRGEAEDPVAEYERYSDILVRNPIDIACVGIGENGHLAFNDPPVADFLDPRVVKIVELDGVCRQQQVNDGCFEFLEAVPTHALTLTIPAIMSAKRIYRMVPGTTKVRAVREALRGPVSTSCPASILRRHLRSVLYLDGDSAAEV